MELKKLVGANCVQASQAQLEYAVRTLEDRLGGTSSESSFAVWALGTVASTDERCRAAVLQHSLPLLVAAESSMVPCALRQICSTLPHPLMVACAFPYLARSLASQEAEELYHSLVAITRLCDKPEWVGFLLDADPRTPSRIAGLIEHCDLWVRNAAKRAGQAMVSGAGLGGAGLLECLTCLETDQPSTIND